MKASELSRRAVLGGVAGGMALLLGFRTVGGVRSAVREDGRTFAPNAFLRIAEDGATTAIISPAEMGQGIHTALAMVLAEELDVNWDSIKVEPAPADPARYGNVVLNGLQTTEASASMLGFYATTRLAGAAARMMLLEAGARRWKVPRNQCRTANSTVISPDGKTIGYGALVPDVIALTPPAVKDIVLKKAEDFKLIGHSTTRLGIQDIVTGKTAYGVDMQLPGMLTAVVAKRPMRGASIRTHNCSDVRKMPGVRAVVEVPSGIALIAEDEWHALTAQQMLEIDWDYTGLERFDAQDIESRLTALVGTRGTEAVRLGDPDTILNDSNNVISAEYMVPYLAHAPMEPLNCIIDANDERVDVWVGSQDQGFQQKLVAKILDRPLAEVNIRNLPMGGGFGRRGSPDGDFVVETAEIVKAAKFLGAPIRNMWSRADDIQGGFYRPMAVNQLSAVLKDGALTAWRHRIAARSPLVGTEFDFLVTNGIDASQVAGARDIPYAISNLSCELHSPEFGPSVGWLRSVGNSNVAFAVESFIDELAFQSGTDPVLFRRRLLAGKKGSERLLITLELAARHSGWRARLPPNQGRGVAVHDYWGSKATQVAEVRVENNTLFIDRITCVIDCGLAVNPDGVRAQVEGAIIFGLSAALYGEITFSEGITDQANFDTYPILRMDACPEINVHIVESQEAPGGVGEVGVPHVAPAICNAIFAATGKRIRKLPLARSGLQV